MKLGWQQNPPDSRDYKFKAAQPSTLKTNSLAPLVPEVYDQGPTSSCVAQAIAAAVAIQEVKAGIVYHCPSRLFMYYNSRAMHHMQGTDSGTFARTCLKSMKKLGVPDELHWGFDEPVNQRPGWEPAAMAAGRMGGTYEWLPTTGRLEAVKSAIDAGYPVAFGTLVTEAFTQNSGPYVEGVPMVKDTKGGHMMLIVGYTYDDFNNSTYFQVLNSWGTDWRMGGFAYLSSGYINWKYSRDFVIVHGWEEIR